MEWNQVVLGDSRAVLKTLPDASVDAIVTDPPAGIEFMGKEWDTYRTGRLEGYSAPPQQIKQGEAGADPSRFGWMGSLPSIKQGANQICTVCNHYKFSGTPCTCEAPKWAKDTSTRDTFIAFLRDIMAECIRVLKPGGHMLVWSIPRTSHWTATAIEDAGFEIRDCIHHCFGSGFPKSLNVSKALDKMAGAERKVIKPGKGYDPEKNSSGQFNSINPSKEGINTPAFIARIGEVTAPATPEAVQWDGWGTSLKPAVETWWLCRKPIEAPNVASQVLRTGTGGININGCRVGAEARVNAPAGNKAGGASYNMGVLGMPEDAEASVAVGRWPSNLVLSHGPGCKRIGSRTVDAPVINQFEDGMKPFGDGAGHPYTSKGGGTEEQAVYDCEPGCPIGKLDEQSGASRSVPRRGDEGAPLDASQENWRFTRVAGGFEDEGGASRYFANFEPDYDVPFFYTGKASTTDKNTDLRKPKAAEDMTEADFIEVCAKCVRENTLPCTCEEPQLVKHPRAPKGNPHPTVKSQALMRYLVRLVTPPGGIVLDPFAGSGSTLVAAVAEGFQCLGVEREPEYHHVASTRLQAALDRAKEEAAQKEAFDSIFDMPQE